jgi:hypothetical protein
MASREIDTFNKESRLIDHFVHKDKYAHPVWSDRRGFNGLIDRRRGRRFDVDWLVTVGGARGSRLLMESGRVANISSSGALLVLKSSFEAGSRVEVYVRLPMKGTNWMKYSGRVSRTDWLGSEQVTAVSFDEATPSLRSEAGE